MIENQGLSVEALNLESINEIDENGKINSYGDSEKGDEK